MFDWRCIGPRVRALRKLRGLPQRLVGKESTISRMEGNFRIRCGFYLGIVERTAAALQVDLHTFLLDDQEFERWLLLEDEFIREIVPLVKRLTDQQKAEVLCKIRAAAS